MQRLQQRYILGIARRLLEADLAYQGLADQEIETLLSAGLAQASGIEKDGLPRPLYVVVEKILGAHEALRKD